jgi:predicted lipoprotein with Yx(FWY)xxD motif
MRNLRLTTFATVAVAAFALAACGSSSKSSSPPASGDSTTVAPSTTAAPTTTAAAGKAAVTLATTSLGKVLVDENGMTLYQFENDTEAGKSTCGAGQCASTWPAATVTGAATAGSGVTGTVSTFTRADDGKTQLQIDGHPLYRFAGDAKAGDTNGQKILDKWYATNGAGEKVGEDS